MQSILEGSHEPYQPISPLRPSMSGERWSVVLATRRGPGDRFHSAKSRRGELSCVQLAARNGHVDLVADFLDLRDGWPADKSVFAVRRRVLGHSRPSKKSVGSPHQVRQQTVLGTLGPVSVDLVLVTALVGFIEGSNMVGGHPHSGLFGVWGPTVS